MILKPMRRLGYSLLWLGVNDPELPDKLLLHTELDTSDQLGCRLWLRAQDHGYAILNVTERGKPKRYRVHVLWWRHHHPDEEHVGLEFAHSCGKKLCIVHARPKTHQGNMAEDPGRDWSTVSKLDADSVRLIRHLHAEGRTQEELASRFGVSQTAISRIVLGKTWRHVQ